MTSSKKTKFPNESKIGLTLNEDCGGRQQFIAKQRFAWSTRLENTQLKYYEGKPNSDKSLYSFRSDKLFTY